MLYKLFSGTTCITTKMTVQNIPGVIWTNAGSASLI